MKRNHLKSSQIESLEAMVLMSATSLEPTEVDPTHEIDGTNAGEWISGTDDGDLIAALGGNDEIYAPLGENFIDGGDGSDTLVIYEGGKADYDIQATADGRVIVEGPGLNGQTVKQELANVEQILFTDGMIFVSDLIVDPVDPTAPVAADEPLIVDPNNDIVGTNAGEWISGSERNDFIQALDGNDEIYAPIGENFINGGGGTDTLVIYEGDKANFNVYRSSDGRTFVEGPGVDGRLVVQEMVNVEQILFNDGLFNVNDAPVTLIVDPSNPVDPVDPGDNLLVNGSFEANASSEATHLFLDANTVEGWSSVNGQDLELWFNDFGSVSPTDGNNLLELDYLGGDTPLDAIYQDVQTTAGQMYQLTFDIQARDDNPGSDDEAIVIMWNDTRPATRYTAAEPGEWTTHTVLVEGTGGADRLTIRESISPGASDSTGPLLDNFRLKAVDTVAPTGFVGLGATQVTVDEDSSTAELAIQRTGGSAGTASVYYQTLAIEATDGVDFVGTESGRVDFVDGQTTAFISVPLIDDQLTESTENFSVSLFRAEGAELGEPRTATVTIVDDESGQGLVGHWKLDETAIGQTVVDSSGNGNDGVHHNLQAPNGPTTDDVDLNSGNLRALDVDGADDYISIDGDPSLDLSDGEFTQSVWVKPEATGTTWQGVVGYQDVSGAVNRYPGIWVQEDTRIHAGFGDGTTWNNFSTGDVLTLGEWNHIATTFDGTTYKAYANGVEVYSTNDFAGKNPVAGDQVDVGRVDNYFAGGIDDVRIYDRALSAAEVGVLLDGADVPGLPLSGSLTTSTLATGFDTPVEVETLADGRILVAEQHGIVKIVNADGSVEANPLLDIRDIVNSGTKDRGMIGFAVHPDFENNPYVYAAYTYDPPEVNGETGLGGPDGNGARVARISRFTVNEAGTYADPASNVVLIGQNSTYANIGNPDIRPGLNDAPSCVDENGNPLDDCIASDETSHTIGELEFGPDGMLYIASGDGGSFGRVDPINLRALDIDSLQGKILRIDPITGDGLSDNPFYDGDGESNQSKVFAYGLRNPFRFEVNGTADNPEVYIGDVGWTQWEEINVATGGENFGWPAFEGGDGESLQTGGYKDLAAVQEYYATNPDVTDPAWARLHSSGARAIVMGDFIGAEYGVTNDTLLFTDIGDQLLRAATFDDDGNVVNVETVSDSLGFIVDIHTGADGLLYYVDVTGSIGKLELA